MKITTNKSYTIINTRNEDKLNPVNSLMISQNFNLIQWNLNGFHKKYNELQLLIQKHNPKILCLQETNFKDNSIGNIPAYIGYHKNRINAIRSSGGVAVYISDTLYSTKLNLITNLEAIAIKIHGKEIITVCNIYLPNHTNFNDNDLVQLISQLPTPYIITGDFNSHNEIWGSLTTDKRGKTIERILKDDNITLLNKEKTHDLTHTMETFQQSICHSQMQH